jgi:hypothetical protein
VLVEILSCCLLSHPRLPLHTIIINGETSNSGITPQIESDKLLSLVLTYFF